MRRFLLLSLLILVGTAWPLSFAAADPSAPGGGQDLLAAQGTGWIAGHTSVSDLSYEEKLNRLGWIPNPKPGFAPYFVPKRDPKTLPTKLDWRDNGGDFVTGVRDQEDCGSCYAFAGVGAVESAWAIALGMDNPTLDLSEQFIVSCESLLGCSGGWSEDVLLTAKAIGIPDEWCMDYSAYDEDCDRKCDDWALRTLALEDYQIVLEDPADTEEEYLQIMQALQEGPVSVSFDVHEDFFYYEGGIYSQSGAYMGGHAVVLVGYDADARYWICKNSWGSGWGESGYFRIRWGSSNLGDETLLPITPECTNEKLAIRPMLPAQNFIRYSLLDMPMKVRVTSDCLRGVAGALLSAEVLGVSIPFYDDGLHDDEAANDGIFGGTFPASLLQRGPIEIVLEATHPLYESAEFTLNGHLKYPADLLIVSDDGDFNAIDTYGPIFDVLGIDYDVWDTTEQRRWPLEDMLDAPAVFWFTGPSLSNFFRETESAAISEYLDAGGNLLIIGQDLLQNIYDLQWQFTRNYIKVARYWNDTQYENVGGIAGDFLTDGLGGELNMPFTNWVDTIKPMDEAVETWLNGNGKITGLRYPPEYDGVADYRLVFSGFPLEALPVDQMTTYLQRVMDWFYHDVCYDTDGDGFFWGGSCSPDEVLDCENDDPNSYPGGTEICDDGNDNDCNGLTDLDDPACEGWGEDDDTTDDDDDAADDDDATDDDDQSNTDDDDDDNDDGCGC